MKTVKYKYKDSAVKTNAINPNKHKFSMGKSSKNLER